MKKLVYLSAIAVAFALLLSLVGCDIILGGFPSNPTEGNADIEQVLPEDITLDNFLPEEGTDYYKSDWLSLVVSVNGYFFKMEYFSVDGNKRIYDNVYLYEEDYFYIITNDYRDIYASLSDPSDSEYAETEREQGFDIQANIKKSGIYRIVFDTLTSSFDLEYKAEIEAPVYYTIKDCSIFTSLNGWVQMQKNPENSEEFYIRALPVGQEDAISFHSDSHVSRYKITLDGQTEGRYASARKGMVTMNIGGEYDVFVNSKTYEVRMVLANPEEAEYSCIYHDGRDFVVMEEEDEPYIFRRTFTVDKKYTNLPRFYSASYQEYPLAVKGEYDFLYNNDDSYYFTETGDYYIIVNLLTFEITVEKMAE